MVSSKEILEATGIKNPKTLTRWHQQELIPPPIIRTHTSGRGKLAFWESWVVLRIREVKRRLAEGRSLEEIREELGADWDAEAKRLQRRRRSMVRAEENAHRQEARSKFAESVALRIYNYLQTIGIQRPGNLAALERAVADPRLISAALNLCRKRCQPVVLIRSEQSKLTCEMVDKRLLRAIPDAEPILIVPVEADLVAAYSLIEPDLAGR